MGKAHDGRFGDAVEIEDGGAIIVKSGGRVTVQSGGKVEEEAGGSILGREVLNCYHADIGTAGSAFVVCPFDGDVVGLEAVNIAANAGTKSVLTAKIGGSAITHPAWEVAVSASAGTRSGVTPTAANAIKAGQVIEIASDGGSSAVTPAMYSITVRRAS
jgi:hypothetical protein